MIYVDEAAMLHHVFGKDWPRELFNVHELTEQIYCEWVFGERPAGR